MKRVRVGRSPINNDVVLAHDGVSARHLDLIIRDEGSCTVIDRGSSNGTFVLREGVRTRIDRARLNLDNLLWLGGYETTPEKLIKAEKPNVVPLEEETYDAFISYSRRDKEFASRLEETLERYALPTARGEKKRHFNIFRDEQDLVGGDYSESIDRVLQVSRKLILICSPRAAKSEFVGDEIRRFSELHGSANIVPVLLDGVPNNEATDDDEERLAFPPSLLDDVDMPLAIDYSQTTSHRPRLDRGVFEDAWHTILASLLDVSRSQIEQRELSRRRAFMRRAGLGLGVFALTMGALAVYALVQRNDAVFHLELAKSQRAFALTKATELDENILVLLQVMNVRQAVGETAVPGTLDLRAPQWKPLLQNRRVSARGTNREAFLAAREVGKGRVVAAAHDGILNLCDPYDRTCGESDTELQAFFLRLVTGWLGFQQSIGPADRLEDVRNNEAKPPIRIGLTTSHCEVIPVAYPQVGEYLEALLRSFPGYFVHRIEGEVSPEKLSAIDLLIVGNAWGNFSEPEISTVQRFVNEGGGLLAVGLGWSWQMHLHEPFGRAFCQGPPLNGQDTAALETYPMNRLLAPYSISFTNIEYRDYRQD